jgi:hypothetical protein
MKRMAQILVVANRTALSSDLERVMRARATRGPARFTLLVPMAAGSGADWIAGRMASSLRELGLDVDWVVGDADPLQAVRDTWATERFDEVIVSTLPAASSRWMIAGLLHEIEHHTGRRVSHVEAGAKRDRRRQTRDGRSRREVSRGSSGRGGTRKAGHSS